MAPSPSMVALFALIAAIIWTCGGTLFSPAAEGKTRLRVLGFSAAAEPLVDAVLPRFRTRWRAEHGEDVTFDVAFAASGTIANQIVNGTPADVAILSHPGDADRIAAAGRAARPWREGPNGGIVNRTPIVIAVRPGNPLKIRRFADLARADVRVVHPDPATSGGAVWALFAAYGEALREARERAHADPAAFARERLAAIRSRVIAQAPSARAARTQFDQGFGDALVTYEVEMRIDAAHGRAAETVLPEETVLCEHPAVLVRRARTPADDVAASRLLDYLSGAEAQAEFVRAGFRPARGDARAPVADLPRIAAPLDVASLGGFTGARDACLPTWLEGREGGR